MILEICIDAIDSALAAKSGGADRLEVCSSLAAGGTTPSIGLVRRCVDDIGLPVMMMIRPHDGPFVYHDQDVQIMLEDIDAGISAGVAGFVFGCLHKNDSLNIEQCRTLLSATGDRETTFHRAFDVANMATSPLKMLDQLIELGFDRLLTSGRAATAEKGSELIKQLVEHADGRIKILAGAGVSSENAKRIVEAAGITELHASASVPLVSTSSSAGEVSFGNACRVTVAKKVKAIKIATSNR